MFDFFKEAKGAGAADLVLEAGRRQGHVATLGHDGGAVEVDGHAVTRGIGRRQAGALAVMCDFDTGARISISRRGASCSAMPATSIRKHKRVGTAIHDRHFAGIDFDRGIVDAAGAQRCHQMFNRPDLPPWLLPIRCTCAYRRHYPSALQWCARHYTRSVRVKTMPVFSGAGIRRKLTRRPNGRLCLNIRPPWRGYVASLARPYQAARAELPTLESNFLPSHRRT